MLKLSPRGFPLLFPQLALLLPSWPRIKVSVSLQAKVRPRLSIRLSQSLSFRPLVLALWLDQKVFVCGVILSHHQSSHPQTCIKPSSRGPGSTAISSNRSSCLAQKEEWQGHRSAFQNGLKGRSLFPPTGRHESNILNHPVTSFL